MGPRGHQSFLLLLALCATGAFVSATVLSGLPTTVSVMESAGPGTIIVEFNLTCQNETSIPTPVFTLQSTPPTYFFNQPIVAHRASPTPHYSVQITLSPSAALDARQVNQYTLTLEATCPGETPAKGQLFVQVHTVDGPPQCMARFASQVGELVQVSEDVAPLMPIYTVVLQRPASGLRFTIKDNDTPLTIDRAGQVLAPGSGFIPAHAGQVFRLQILVTDRSGRNCSGAVTVTVLPVHRPHINFMAAWRSVAVLEKRGAMQLVTQVQAQGNNVRYEIIAPAAHGLYTIDTVTGELRNTYELDLQRSPEVAHTQLLVRAYDMLHPSDSDIICLNITVLPTSTLAPHCSPAVLLAQVPEDTPIGWTLAMLTCTDPDASNSSLRYQVEGDQHSRYSFRMQGPQLQVNETLDYDSAASARFQYVATILVTDNGQPPLSSEIHVLSPLDYESKQVYILTVQLRDMANDADPHHQHSALCDITIQVQDTNDQPPRCMPPFQEFFIYSTRDPSLPLAQLQCSDKDESTMLPLTYTLVGGNTNGHFRLAGSTLLHSAFSDPPDSIHEPRTFELLVEVTDSFSAPRHSTTATLVVHVTPWATATPSTTTIHTTLRKGPLVVTHTEWFWAPSPWFVVVLTVSVALLLVALAWLAWKLLCRSAPGKSAQPLLQDSRSSLMAVPRTPLQVRITSSTAAPERAAGSEQAPPPLGLSGHSFPRPHTHFPPALGLNGHCPPPRVRPAQPLQTGHLEWARL
nr:cadherin-related family member 4 isoform X4 [Caretta caretta]